MAGTIAPPTRLIKTKQFIRDLRDVAEELTRLIIIIAGLVFLLQSVAKIVLAH
jgi:hypothetical protein